jgi:DNA-binding NarL/FixJ family response regulator
MCAGRFNIGKKKEFEMSPRERSSTDFLVVEPDPESRDQMRSALRANGYTNMYHAADHMQAYNVLMERNFTHTMFSTTVTNMPVTEYVEKVISTNPGIVAIAASYEPSADDVFELLRLGARGLIVKPYTIDSMESSILMATKGDRLAEAVLQARDRNEAFSALVAANLDKLADAQRQGQTIASAKREIERLKANFEASAEMARMFAKDGEEVLRERMVDFFIELSSGPASRLGRLRHKLRKKRKNLDVNGEEIIGEDDESQASTGS